MGLFDVRGAFFCGRHAMRETRDSMDQQCAKTGGRKRLPKIAFRGGLTRHQFS